MDHVGNAGEDRGFRGETSWNHVPTKKRERKNNQIERTVDVRGILYVNVESPNRELRG